MICAVFGDFFAGVLCRLPKSPHQPHSQDDPRIITGLPHHGQRILFSPLLIGITQQSNYTIKKADAQYIFVNHGRIRPVCTEVSLHKDLLRLYFTFEARIVGFL